MLLYKLVLLVAPNLT